MFGQENGESEAHDLAIRFSCAINLCFAVDRCSWVNIGETYQIVLRRDVCTGSFEQDIVVMADYASKWIVREEDQRYDLRRKDYFPPE